VKIPRVDAPSSRRDTTLADWDARITARLVEAERHIAVVARATPVNLKTELEALEADFAAGRPRPARFRYEPAPPHALEGDLLRLADVLAREPHPLAALYRERAEELALEHRMTTRVGTRDLWRLARERYRTSPALGEAADEVASRWLEAPASGAAAASECVRSDDEGEPQSLVSRLTAELGARRLPVRVATTDRIAALAATGDGLVVVARGRWLSLEDVERTVLHEIEGHVMPRERAHRLTPGLFRVGTAKGSDDQEGRALVLEERHGHLGPSRRRELALRHLAARAVEREQDFVETVALLRDRGAPLGESLRLAARAHRGGGLAREIVYLPAYLTVKDALERAPALDDTLGSGRIAVGHAPLVRDHARPLVCALRS